MRKKLGTLAIAAALGWLSYTLYNTHGTLEPCGMLQSEVQVRLMQGDLETLGNVPDLVMNNGDQIWCTTEFVKLHLP